MNFQIDVYISGYQIRTNELVSSILRFCWGISKTNYFFRNITAVFYTIKIHFKMRWIFSETVYLPFLYSIRTPSVVVDSERRRESLPTLPRYCFQQMGYKIINCFQNITTIHALPSEFIYSKVMNYWKFNFKTNWILDENH